MCLEEATVEKILCAALDVLNDSNLPASERAGFLRALLRFVVDAESESPGVRFDAVCGLLRCLHDAERT